jgi:chromatin remodeling complex protein RSC6
MARSKAGSAKPAAKKAAVKKAVKKVAVKKVAAKKAPAKKAPAKKAAGLRGGIAQLVKPSAALAAVIGDKPITRAELTKKIWDYIKTHKLQDAKDRRAINADDKLKPVFGGKAQVSMFEMTKLVSRHLS